MPNALDTYLSALRKFQECAAPIMENLAKAREAHEEALRASAEIRQILNSQDDALCSVMSQLQEAVSRHLVPPKKEPTKLIEMSPPEESGAALTRQNQEADSKSADEETGGGAPPAPKKKASWM